MTNSNTLEVTYTYKKLCKNKLLNYNEEKNKREERKNFNTKITFWNDL